MNKIKICCVVNGTNLKEFISNLESVQKIADLIELRVDYIENLRTSDIREIKSKIIKPAIFTCRKKTEGGKYSGNEEARTELVMTAIQSQFDYVDIEYSTLKQHTFPKNEVTKIITSYHDFDKTPPYWQLTKLVFDMNTVGADIIKIATYINSDYDQQVLFRLLLSKKPDDNQIIIGMGEKGKKTRILGPLLGSYLTYASTHLTSTAPGQIDLETLQKIYQILQ